EQAPDMVCGINHAFLTGVVDGLAAASVTAVLDPKAGECCVELHATSSSTSSTSTTTPALPTEPSATVREAGGPRTRLRAGEGAGEAPAPAGSRAVTWSGFGGR